MDTRHLPPDSNKSSESLDFAGRESLSGLLRLDPSRARSWITVVGLGVFLAVAAACSGPSEDSASNESALAESGRWAPPAEVLAIGRTVRVTYDEAPRWTNSAACGGKLLPGGHKLGEYLLDHFPVVTSVGGYACRRNTADSSRMSVHGTGRALDVFIPTTGGAADNGQGDTLANWLVTHAKQIGVQLVIWDRSVWRSNGTNTGAYTGPNPHIDHIHVELTNEAAALTTPWFSTMDDEDASTGDSGTPRRDGGTTRPDSGTETPDAGDYQGDAATGDPADDDHIDDEPDAADAAPDAKKAPPSSTGTPSDGLPSEGDGPGETDSLPDVPSTSRKKSPSTEIEATPNGGCSAAPRSQAPLGSLGGTMALGLGLAALLRRKRR